MAAGRELQFGFDRGNVLVSGGAHCNPRSLDRVKLFEPNQVFGSRSLRLTKDEPIIIINVEARAPYTPWWRPHQVKVVVHILEVRFVLLDGFLTSLGH